MDELPVLFEPIVSPTSFEQTEEASFQELLEARHAHAVIWITCADCRIHLFTPFISPSDLFREINLNDAGKLAVEPITAIIRNWLEAVIPAVQQSKRKVADTANPGTPTSVNANTNDDNVPSQPAHINSIAYMSLESNTRQPGKAINSSASEHERLSSFRRVHLAAGLDATSIGESRLLPGGYAGILVQLHERLSLSVSASRMKTARFSKNTVSTNVRKVPLRWTVHLRFPWEGFMGLASVGCEMDPVRRDTTIAGALPKRTWKVQPALIGLAGFAIPFGNRVSFTFQAGVRVLLKKTIFRIRVGPNTYTLHDPWLIQPLLLTGLQRGLFQEGHFTRAPLWIAPTGRSHTLHFFSFFYVHF
ncbi:MAG: hypothetical protein JXR76_12505 [Deltaproteobacteria bacterium]|nr:hypothetical protein [Deltaproteobacteria bacterium]